MISRKQLERFFGLCHEIQKWSPCHAGRQHACIIVVDGMYPIAFGYNDVACKEHCAHVEACKTAENTPEGCAAIHAEENAIINLARIGFNRLADCEAVLSKEPCPACRSKLKNLGIRRVHWHELRPNGSVVEASVQI